VFWYAIQIEPDCIAADGWRFTEDRTLALMAMVVLRLRVRVAAKPL
jgi:hypothetical protein